MGIWNFSDLFSQKWEGPRWPDLLIPVTLLLNFWDIKFSARKLFKGRRQNYILSHKKSFFAKMTTCIIQPRTPSFWPSQSFLAQLSLVDALESLHQGDFVFGHLALFRRITKNDNLVHIKQTLLHSFKHPLSHSFWCQCPNPQVWSPWWPMPWSGSFLRSK